MPMRSRCRGGDPRTSRPHVLFVIQDGSFSYDNRVQRESATLREAGYIVQVISPRWEGDPRYDVTRGVSVHYYKSRQFSDSRLGYVAEYLYSIFMISVFSLRISWRQRVDVVHLSNPPDLLILAVYPLKLTGTRVVFDHHDLAPELYGSKFGLSDGLIHRTLIWLERFSCRHADRVIATNRSYREIEVRRAGIAPEKIAIVRNGPDMRRFSHCVPDKSLKRGFSHLVCYLGNMNRQDGVEYLVRGMHHIHYTMDRRDIGCVCIGAGPVREELEMLAESLGLSEIVEFTGRIPDDQLMRYLATADVCACPDPKNPLNDVSTMNKTMEYMAVGKPIVAFDLKETRVSAGAAAMYAIANDVDDFARKIVNLVDDQELRNDMGRSGRRRVQEVLSWEHSKDALLALYDELAPVDRKLP